MKPGDWVKHVDTLWRPAYLVVKVDDEGFVHIKDGLISFRPEQLQLQEHPDDLAKRLRVVTGGINQIWLYDSCRNHPSAVRHYHKHHVQFIELGILEEVDTFYVRLTNYGLCVCQKVFPFLRLYSSEIEAVAEPKKTALQVQKEREERLQAVSNIGRSYTADALDKTLDSIATELIEALPRRFAKTFGQSIAAGDGKGVYSCVVNEDIKIALNDITASIVRPHMDFDLAVAADRVVWIRHCKHGVLLYGRECIQCSREGGS